MDNAGAAPPRGALVTQRQRDSAITVRRLDSLGRAFDAEAAIPTSGLSMAIVEAARAFHVSADSVRPLARSWMGTIQSDNPHVIPGIALGAIPFAIERDRIRAPLPFYFVELTSLSREYAGDPVAVRSAIVGSVRRMAGGMKYRCDITGRCVTPLAAGTSAP